MKHARFILSAVLLGALGLASYDAWAQRADPCAIVGEEIVNVRPPEFDRALRWKRTYGVEGEDKIISLVPLADLGFVAGGVTTPAAQKSGKGKI